MALRGLEVIKKSSYVKMLQTKLLVLRRLIPTKRAWRPPLRV